MPKRSQQNQLDRGLCTPPIIAKFLGVHANTVRYWIKKGSLEPLPISGHRDYLVPATRVVVFAQERGYGVNEQLQKAADIYSRMLAKEKEVKTPPVAMHRAPDPSLN